MSEENKWVTDLPDEDKNASAEQKPLTHPYSEGRRMQESGQDSYAGAGQSEGTSQEKPKYGHYEVHQPQAGNYAGGNIPPKKPRKKREFSGNNSFGKKAATAVALAVIFGLVAGVVFQGVNIAADKYRGNDSSTTIGKTETVTGTEDSTDSSSADSTVKDIVAESGTVAGVAQVKFRLQTLDSAKRLMSEYAELEFYKEEYRKAGNCKISFDSIVGTSEAFLEKKRLGLKAAWTDFAVLLTGETGTGKELFARAIHNASNRADKPMVSINCAAIPSELLESELFGYADGAFTGARKGGKPGKFQLANGGTLFLDEIGDMPLNMQAKILRTLQESEVEPVGGSGPVPVDVRVISATRQNLPKLIESGDFREDLYYRLNVINIEIPSLRERRGDILDLSNHFLSQLNQEFQRTTVLSPEVKRCFVSYQWPGNVRELDNVIKGAYATCDGFTIDLTDLPGKMSPPKDSLLMDSRKQLAELMNDYEREVILAVLRDKGGNCQRTAEELGIHRSALYKKMNKLGIDPAAIPHRQTSKLLPE